MTIEVITCWYREHYLAPLFLQHYEPWVDRITVITKRLQGVRGADGQPGPVLNDHIKADWINEAVRASGADWIICVDADEFVFPVRSVTADYRHYIPTGDEYRTWLERVPGHYTHIIAELHRVWTHATDRPVDFNQPPVPQRVHGEAGVPQDYQKPCIFRGPRFDAHGRHKPVVGMGCHHLLGVQPAGCHPNHWYGAHWQQTTRELQVGRRMDDRVMRVAKEQYAWQIKYLPTPDELDEGYRAHLNDPVIFLCNGE